MTKQFDPAKPVRTRDGRKARIVCTDSKLPNYPIIALVEQADGSESILYVGKNGIAAITSLTSSWDLINIPERTSRWIKVSLATGYATKSICMCANWPKELDENLMEIIFEDGNPVDVKLHKDEK